MNITDNNYLPLELVVIIYALGLDIMKISKVLYTTERQTRNLFNNYGVIFTKLTSFRETIPVFI